MIRSSVSKLLICLLALAACHPGVVRAADPNAADTVGMDWSKVPEYRIVPGDKLSIDMGPKPDPSQEYVHEVVVRPDGRITVYPVGDVVAAGLTPMELQKSLITLLSADLRMPRATVEVVTMAANQVHVIGRVQRAGSVVALPFMTVSQALTAAGGFTDDASRSSVLLLHREGAHTVRVTRVPMDRVLKGTSYFDPVVSRFDIIVVPRNTVGNTNVFLRSFFEGVSQGVSTAFIGWELFHLDRVFTGPYVR